MTKIYNVPGDYWRDGGEPDVAVDNGRGQVLWFSPTPAFLDKTRDPEYQHRVARRAKRTAAALARLRQKT